MTFSGIGNLFSSCVFHEEWGSQTSSPAQVSSTSLYQKYESLAARNLATFRNLGPETDGGAPGVLLDEDGNRLVSVAVHEGNQMNTKSLPSGARSLILRVCSTGSKFSPNSVGTTATNTEIKQEQERKERARHDLSSSAAALSLLPSEEIVFRGLNKFPHFQEVQDVRWIDELARCAKPPQEQRLSSSSFSPDLQVSVTLQRKMAGFILHVFSPDGVHLRIMSKHSFSGPHAQIAEQVFFQQQPQQNQEQKKRDSGKNVFSNSADFNTQHSATRGTGCKNTVNPKASKDDTNHEGDGHHHHRSDNSSDRFLSLAKELKDRGLALTGECITTSQDKFHPVLDMDMDEQIVFYSLHTVNTHAELTVPTLEAKVFCEKHGLRFVPFVVLHPAELPTYIPRLLTSVDQWDHCAENDVLHGVEVRGAATQECIVLGKEKDDEIKAKKANGEKREKEANRKMFKVDETPKRIQPVEGYVLTMEFPISFVLEMMRGTKDSVSSSDHFTKKFVFATRLKIKTFRYVIARSLRSCILSPSSVTNSKMMMMSAKPQEEKCVGVELVDSNCTSTCSNISPSLAHFQGTVFEILFILWVALRYGDPRESVEREGIHELIGKFEEELKSKFQTRDAPQDHLLALPPAAYHHFLHPSRPPVVVVILCGLPGSGKTSICEELLQLGSANRTIESDFLLCHISRDAVTARIERENTDTADSTVIHSSRKKRKFVHTEVLSTVLTAVRCALHPTAVLLDACHASVASRNVWHRSLPYHVRYLYCNVFCSSRKVLVQRALQRPEHPTLKKSEVQKAIFKIGEKMTFATDAELRPPFDALITINTHDVTMAQGAGDVFTALKKLFRLQQQQQQRQPQKPAVVELFDSLTNDKKDAGGCALTCGGVAAACVGGSTTATSKEILRAHEGLVRKATKFFLISSAREEEDSLETHHHPLSQAITTIYTTLADPSNSSSEMLKRKNAPCTLSVSAHTKEEEHQWSAVIEEVLHQLYLLMALEAKEGTVRPETAPSSKSSIQEVNASVKGMAPAATERESGNYDDHREKKIEESELRKAFVTAGHVRWINGLITSLLNKKVEKKFPEEDVVLQAFRDRFRIGEVQPHCTIGYFTTAGGHQGPVPAQQAAEALRGLVGNLGRKEESTAQLPPCFSTLHIVGVLIDINAVSLEISTAEMRVLDPLSQKLTVVASLSSQLTHDAGTIVNSGASSSAAVTTSKSTEKRSEGESRGVSNDSTPLHVTLGHLPNVPPKYPIWMPSNFAAWEEKNKEAMAAKRRRTETGEIATKVVVDDDNNSSLRLPGAPRQKMRNFLHVRFFSPLVVQGKVKLISAGSH